MVCYHNREKYKEPIKVVKSSQGENPANATVKVDVLSKEVNHVLNSANDTYILSKYRNFQKQVKVQNDHHVFKRL